MVMMMMMMMMCERQLTCAALPKKDRRSDNGHCRRRERDRDEHDATNDLILYEGHKRHDAAETNDMRRRLKEDRKGGEDEKNDEPTQSGTHGEQLDNTSFSTL